LDTLQTIQQTNEEEQENDNDNDETEQNSNQIEVTNENKTTNNNNTEFEDFINEVLNDDTITKDDDDNKNYNFVNRGNNVFVPDVIKEYLHLTASAVKIKFPRVTTFTSEQLINQVKSLPFFQYHDYMSRIMEKEENKIKMQESLLSSNHASPTPNSRKPNHQTNMKQRRSFLSLFGKFFFPDEDEINKTQNSQNNNNDNKTPNDNNQHIHDASHDGTNATNNNIDNNDNISDDENKKKANVGIIFMQLIVV